MRRILGRRLLAICLLAGAVLVVAPTADAITSRSAFGLLLVQDDCEPNSFNAAIGPDTCVGNGTTTFDEFIAELAATQNVAAWRFVPPRQDVLAGSPVVAINAGGEFHTVTRVQEFGGGFVPELNELSGTPIPAPECFLGPGLTNLFLGPHSAGVLGPLPVGENKLMCCVHPWMRATVHQHG